MVEDLDKEVESVTGVIQELYASDDMPWIIGYSGGKDSTVCVQLIWNALLRMPEDERKKPVYVISTDTLVENPIVADWVTKSLEKMEAAAQKAKLPIRPRRLVPKLEDRFWVNLIGKGYPSPRPRFRWCTERLKIQTATSFIQNLAETNGEAIMVLGTRRAESAARAHSINKYAGSSREHLSRNADPKLSRVWVYAPIVDWSNDDVWEYIGTHENPWGVESDDLITLYRGATEDNECPVIHDSGTQSCGDSRFGCYVCTMVAQDKSMHAMILNDESKAWMEPILTYRDRFLAPNEKEREYREFHRLNSDKLSVLNNRLIHGPYTQKYRRELLRQLLLTQEECRRGGQASGFGQIELIGRDELEEIRRIWVEEKGEIEDWVPRIYEEVVGHPYLGNDLEKSPLQNDDLEILREVCAEWIHENKPTLDADQEKRRGDELYQLVRTLLANTYRTSIDKHRSKQLDDVEKILKRHAFLDEEAATEFAVKYITSNRTDEKISLETMMSYCEDTTFSKEEAETEELTERQKSLTI